MYEFKYHRPGTVRQAANLLVKNEDAKLIAGGHTLVPVMKQRLASPPHLVDLSHIEGLDTHRDEGPLAGDRRHRQARRRRQLADRRRGDPGAGRTRRPDRRSRGAPQGHHRRLARQQRSDRGLSGRLLALGATIVTNKRRLKAEEFFQGLFTTALEADEIITRVMFPLPKKAAYVKFRNQASRYALVGVFVARRPSDVRVAVTGAGSDGVFRVDCIRRGAEEALLAQGARWHRRCRRTG